VEVRLMETEKGSGSDPQGERARRPYERPGVSWEEDFEPYVYMTCGKMPGGGGGCAVNPYSG
jgi:hypothetical protein